MTAQNSSTPPSNNTTSNTHNYPHQNIAQLPQPQTISDHTSGGSSHLLLSQQYRNASHRSNSDLHQSYSSANPSSSSAFSLFSSAEPTSRHHSTSSSTSSHPIHQQHLSSQLLPISSFTTPQSNIFPGSVAKPAGGGAGSGSAGSSHLNNLALAQLNLLLTTTNEKNYDVKNKEIRKVCITDTIFLL